MPATDSYQYAKVDRLMAPSSDLRDLAAEVSDATELTNVTIGIRVNVDGTVTLKTKDSATAVPVYLIAGIDYGYRVKQVLSTGTDAGLKAAGKIIGIF